MGNFCHPNPQPFSPEKVKNGDGGACFPPSNVEPQAFRRHDPLKPRDVRGFVVTMRKERVANKGN
jgi:hypothetical protein